MKKIWSEMIAIASNEDTVRDLIVRGWWDRVTETTRIEIKVRDVNQYCCDVETVYENTYLLEHPTREAATRELIALADAELQRQRSAIRLADQPENLGLRLTPDFL